jgi:hypothetical protein
MGTKSVALILAAVFMVSACAAQAVSTAVPGANALIVAPRASGVTMVPGPGGGGGATLAGGRYRIAWYAPGCTILKIQWPDSKSGVTTDIPVTLPSGETFMMFPAGYGSLAVTSDCDYQIRFEEAPAASPPAT